MAAAVIGAEGVDVETAASGIASIDGELLWVADLQDIVVDLFDTVFGKAGMPPEGDEVLQQPGLVDLGSHIADKNRAPSPAGLSPSSSI